MIYSEAERKEIERVYGVFKDYIHASKFLDFVWSEKLGYLLLHIDPTKNTIEEDQIISTTANIYAHIDVDSKMEAANMIASKINLGELPEKKKSPKRKIA